MKTTSEKIGEIIDIYSQLKTLWISDDVCLNLHTFRKIANDFIRSENSVSGKLKLPEINRELIYLLSIQPNIKSYAYLKYKELD